MISKQALQNFIKELKERHINSTSKYKVSEKEFDAYLEYIKTNPLNIKTYTGFKHYYKG